jgi:hypothetical protein
MPKFSEETLVYFATLAALVALVICAMLIGAFFPNLLGKVEVFGLGTVTGGLIGLMRSPRLRHEPATIEAYLGKIPNEEGTLAASSSATAELAATTKP